MALGSGLVGESPHRQGLLGALVPPCSAGCGQPAWRYAARSLSRCCKVGAWLSKQPGCLAPGKVVHARLAVLWNRRPPCTRAAVAGWGC